jgi:hypothetical protein
VRETVVLDRQRLEVTIHCFDVRHLRCVITKLNSNWETVINTTLVVFMTVSQLLFNFTIHWFLLIPIKSLTHNVPNFVLKTDNAEGPNSKRFQM